MKQKTVKLQYNPIIQSIGPLEFAAATSSFVALGLTIAMFINSRKDKEEIKTEVEELRKQILNINPNSKKPDDNSSKDTPHKHTEHDFVPMNGNKYAWECSYTGCSSNIAI